MNHRGEYDEAVRLQKEIDTLYLKEEVLIIAICKNRVQISMLQDDLKEVNDIIEGAGS